MLLYIRILLKFYFHHLFVSVLLVVLDESYMLIFRSLGDHATMTPPASYCKAETRKQLVKKYQFFYKSTKFIYYQLCFLFV